MWTRARPRAGHLFRQEITSRPAGPRNTLSLRSRTQSCQRCRLSTRSSVALPTRASLEISTWGRRELHQSQQEQPIQGEEGEGEFVTLAEEDNARMLETAWVKVEEFRKASEEMNEDSTVEQQKQRVKILKEYGPLAEAWQSYGNLRKAIIETRCHLDEPDPTLREMFEAEYEGLVTEFDNLIEKLLPQLILPPLPTANLPVMMTLTAGIGGGESARFVEEVSKMYIRYGEMKSWKVEVLSAVEGAMAKGSGGNGFREMTIKFYPAEYAEDGAECFGELMWERGVHRVQRVPPGATVDKLHSSTINLTVLPIYPDTPDEPLVDPKDVKEEVMRAGGAGGQHVNRTESAVRLVHEPTGITVSMQDSRSQHQNRAWAWDVLRARLSEKKRQDEQEAKNAARLTQVKGSGRGERVRTYNFPQNRITDHRIGFSTSALEQVLSGDGFGILVDALKKDLANRRLENLLQGEDDLME